MASTAWRYPRSREPVKKKQGDLDIRREAVQIAGDGFQFMKTT
jgi:hypothetical protein